MNKIEILEKLKEIFAMINPNADLSKIDENSKLKEDLAMTSLSMVYIVVALENEFDKFVKSQVKNTANCRS